MTTEEMLYEIAGKMEAWETFDPTFIYNMISRIEEEGEELTPLMEEGIENIYNGFIGDRSEQTYI